MLRHPEETQPGQSGQSTDPSGLPADSHFDAADPPRGRRSLALALLVVLGLTCLATGCLLYISGSDALRGNTVTDVGNLANANLERAGPFISGTGEPARSALAFERKGERGSKRLVRLAQLVGRERVLAGTDCGFAQGPFYRRVHPSVMWAKLDALVEGARLASDALWR